MTRDRVGDIVTLLFAVGWLFGSAYMATRSWLHSDLINFLIWLPMTALWAFLLGRDLMKRTDKR